MLTLLNESLDYSKPDLVVFLGDMIHGPSLRGKDNVELAIDAVLQPVTQRNIPFAIVFGNHDEECGISNEEQLSIYQSYSGCLAVEGEDMSGCGNYYLLIQNPVNVNEPIVLWFLDSGNHAEQGKGVYGYVKEDQVAWMLEKSQQLKNQYQNPVSYVFQHIPVPHVYKMLKNVPFGTSGAITCYGPNFFKWYVTDPEYVWEGTFGEAPCSSDYDSGEFDAWKQMGVKAAFFGHDHLNNYCGTIDDIDLVATPGMSFYMYGRGDEHGARLVTFSAIEPKNWHSNMLYYRDIATDPLPGLFVSTLGVMIQTYLFIGIGILLVLIIGTVIFVRYFKKGKQKNVTVSGR